jgi:phosphopantetheine adenylyltransferase
MFDKVVLLKGHNPEKKGNFTFDRLSFPAQVQHFEIVPWDKMTHEYLEMIKKVGGDPILVRGLRNGKDLDYEVNQLRFIEEFYPEIKVAYIQCDKEYEHISSSAIRNLLLINEKFAAPYLLK